jgi:uncharacterized protein
MSVTRRAALKGVVATAVGAFTGAAAWGAGFERHALRLVESDLPIANLPSGLDGVRIGFLTDIHHSEAVSAEDVWRAARTAQDARPDLIVLGGDFVTEGDKAYTEPVAEILGSLRAPHGVYAVLGNHDEERTTTTAMNAHHVTMLRDARTSLGINGESLDLVGIRFWTRKASDIARLTRDARGTVLLLAHDPRRLREAAALGVPGVLSGHTHGGQIVFPGLSGVTRRDFPTVAGLATEGQASLFVSRGIGTVYVPVRLNCPPEVVVLTLRRRVSQPA